MIDTTTTVKTTPPPILEGVELSGTMNVSDEVIVANIRHSIRLGHQQVFRTPPKPDRVCLVAGGPSLNETESELVDLVHEGALLVTMNGAYQWCLARNLKPHAQIVVDARASNARFLQPAKPRTRYYLASQCHPESWAAVAGRDFVGIFHPLGPEDTGAPILDAYYGKGRWTPIGGGTTVGTRSIGLLRTLGYLRMDIFGMDCCWLDGESHAYPQEENAKDRRLTFTVHPTGEAEKARRFECAPWHVKQFEDAIRMIRDAGQHFALNVHGRGLLAYAVAATGDVELHEEQPR